MRNIERNIFKRLLKPDILTPTEWQVLKQCFQNCYKYSVVADKLCITEKTVKFHCTNMFRKLGLGGWPKDMDESRACLLTKVMVYYQTYMRVNKGLKWNAVVIDEPKPKFNPGDVVSILPKGYRDKFKDVLPVDKKDEGQGQEDDLGRERYAYEKSEDH